jgi:hypothetical protein
MTSDKLTAADAARELNETDHEWYRTHFTGNLVCAKCHLLPLDEEDFESECEGER